MKLHATLLLCCLTGCASTVPNETVEAKIPVPVIVPCKADIPVPDRCVPKDESRAEWLRCFMIDKERLNAYVKELEATLNACH